MTWIPLLLADPSPCLRLRVLCDLLERDGDDAEVRELTAMREDDPLVAGLLARQESDGSWNTSALEGNIPGGRLQATSQVLTRLGYLGFDRDHPAVARGAAYIFAQQRGDGSWGRVNIRQETGKGYDRSTYDMMPLQTAIPLRGLAACGFATDPRAENAFEWLLAQRMDDGAWPTGLINDNYGYVAGYRRIAHSRWGCRSNTTGALICLALHPARRTSEAARRALDLLLGRETRETQNIGSEVARTIGAEPVGGWITFFARFDLALMLDLCWRMGANVIDDRIADLVAYLRDLQGKYGVWEYSNRPQASRWVTFDILRSLSRLDTETAWMTFEPRTPFRPYQRGQRRF
jgi:hypothetical protein